MTAATDIIESQYDARGKRDVRVLSRQSALQKRRFDFYISILVTF